MIGVLFQEGNRAGPATSLFASSLATKMVAHLISRDGRQPRSKTADRFLTFEPDCKRALAKALGALAIAGETAPDSDWQQLPETIGEYEIVRPLGRGGMGRVFLARHSKLGRQVALKLALIDRLADPRIRRRFDSEMRAVGKLSHPNIVTARDAREIDGTAALGWCR